MSHKSAIGNRVRCTDALGNEVEGVIISSMDEYKTPFASVLVQTDDGKKGWWTASRVEVIAYV